MSAFPITEAESKILSLLWEQSPLTVAEITGHAPGEDRLGPPQRHQPAQAHASKGNRVRRGRKTRAPVFSSGRPK